MLVESIKEAPAVVTTLTPIAAALVGALSVKLWDAHEKSKAKRDTLIVRYLSQLQTTVELLEDRLDNLASHDGRSVMTEDYFRFTTLYALACPLALERIFSLDGIYPQLRGFNSDLYHQLHQLSFDSQLRGFGFHRYYRVALAECAMERDESGLRLAAHFQFRHQYQAALERDEEWLTIAILFADKLALPANKEKVLAIIATLNTIADHLATHTGILRMKRVPFTQY